MVHDQQLRNAYVLSPKPEHAWCSAECLSEYLVCVYSRQGKAVGLHWPLIDACSKEQLTTYG